MSPLILIIPWPENYFFKFRELNMLIRKSIQDQTTRKCANSRFRKPYYLASSGFGLRVNSSISCI